METSKQSIGKDEKAEILQSFSDLPDDVLASLLIGVKFGQMMGRPNTESSAK